MARGIGDKGYAQGLEKIRVISDGSSTGVKEIDKQMVFCKHCRDDIEEDHAKMANCVSSIYLVHTHCEYDCYQSNGNKCPLCQKTPHYISVKLIPVQKPTEKKKSKCRTFFKKANG